MSNPNLALPTTIQQTWQDMELGMFIHFNLFTYAPQWNWRSFKDYPAPDLFRPERLDTDQWMEAARAMGAKYAVLTAKHCEGFCLWPTEVYDYGVRQSSWRGGKGDVVGDFVASCHKYGIRPGLYYSPSANSFLHVDNCGLVGPGSPVSQDEYRRICERQLGELWSRYGELAEIWFDGSTLGPEKGGPDIAPLLAKHQPRASVFQSSCATIRWIGNEDGVAPDPCWATVSDVAATKGGESKALGSGDPDGSLWLPGECDVPMRLCEWGFKPGQEHLVFGVEHLMDLYYRSVGHNCNLLLNANPDPSGLVPQPDFGRYGELGNEIRRRLGTPLARMQSNPTSPGAKSVSASRDRKGAVGEAEGSAAALELMLPRPARVDHVVLMEDISQGHRIRQYKVEAQVGRQWQQVSQGAAVGHKKIDRIAPVQCAALRLTVEQSAAPPQIRTFAPYGE